jgi:hypothetical protein
MADEKRSYSPNSPSSGSASPGDRHLREAELDPKALGKGRCRK